MGEAVLGVMSVDGSNGGIAPVREDESGSIDCWSCIEATIFSKPEDVMCCSLPRLTEKSGYDVPGEEVLVLRGARGERLGSSSGSSESSDSTLEESAGTSFFLGLGLESPIAGVVTSFGCVSQQSVSRAHIRQLRFSNLRPSSTVSAHFEKTEQTISIEIL